MIKNIFNKFRFKFSDKKQELKKHWNKEYFYKYSHEKLLEKNRILDLGCGIGYFLKLGDNNIVGIDASYKSLKEAKKCSNKLVHGNILKLPFSDASFDGINCSHVIEHFKPDDAYQLLLEMNRVLKISGTLIITTPVLWQGFFDDFTHVKPYYPEAIMHYYGEEKTQTTKDAIECIYEVKEIKWRYAKVPLESLLLPRASILNTLLMLLAEFFSNMGFGKYARTGYTMILNKLR